MPCSKSIYLMPFSRRTSYIKSEKDNLTLLNTISKSRLILKRVTPIILLREKLRQEVLKLILKDHSKAKELKKEMFCLQILGNILSIILCTMKITVK